MGTFFDRRDLLRGGAALAAALAAAPARAGQNLDELGKLLGSKLPAPLRAALPQELGQAAQIVAEVIKLEQKAKLLRLPASPLSLGEGAIPTDPERLYEIAMPRLVALIDRAGTISPMLGEQAGGLLARLHRTQYDLPDAWFGGGDPAAPAEGPIRLPGLAPRPLRLADPPDGGPEFKVSPANLPQLALPAAETPLPQISTSLKFADLADEYAAWFAAARIKPQHQETAAWHLTMMRQSRDRYVRVGKRLGVPWYFIATTHALEASFNFRAHLHNGDFPLSRRTHQVPSGRPQVWLPPSDWEASAADALRLMGFAHQEDWSLPRLLHRLEAYNGFGYRRSGRASPYLWSFSNHYDRGKFVADGKFDPRARSQQCGAAVMLKILVEAEPGVLG